MKWRARRDSNPQPSVPKTDALSIELRARKELTLYIPAMSPSTDSLSIQAFSAISRLFTPSMVVWLLGRFFSFNSPRLGNRHGYSCWVGMAGVKGSPFFRKGRESHDTHRTAYARHHDVSCARAIGSASCQGIELVGLSFLPFRVQNISLQPESGHSAG